MLWIYIKPNAAFNKQFTRNKRVSLAIQHTIQVQWSILKYTLDKTKEAYKWQNFLHVPRTESLLIGVYSVKTWDNSQFCIKVYVGSNLNIKLKVLVKSPAQSINWKTLFTQQWICILWGRIKDRREDWVPFHTVAQDMMGF